SRQVVDALLELDDRLRPQPALAASFTVSPDQRVYTFRLRSGVRFHNGRELRAADVKYSFERAARGKRPWVFDKITGARDVIAGRATDMTGLRAIDDLTVESRLDRPFAPFLYLIAYDAAAGARRRRRAPHLAGAGATWPTLGARAVRFNVERAPFDDARVRRAIAHAIDPAIIVDRLLERCVTPARGLLPPALPGYNPEVKRLA